MSGSQDHTKFTWATTRWGIWGVVAILLYSVFCTPARAFQSDAIDLMFVIDNSGSMKKNDPEFITAKVVTTFIKKLPYESRVGMVMFDQKAVLLEPLTDVGSEEAQKQFVASLAKVDYKGQYTNSALGIERALYELKSDGRQDSQKGIVFVTDGIVDTGDIMRDQELNQWLKQDLTAESRSLGVRIFGIAFSDAADFVLIQALAARTDGGYYRIYDAASISGVLDDILTLLILLEPKPIETPSTAQSEPSGPVATPEPELDEPVQVQADQTATPASTTTQPKDQMNNSSIQFLFVILALVVTFLAGVLVFFYIRQMNAMKKAAPKIVPPEVPPEAFLEDLENVLQQGNTPLEIKKARITIGRDPRNDIVIAKPTISSFHATIEYKNMIFYLEDQRSTNGTKLNDNKMQANMPVRLKNGDRINFATFTFKFIIPNQIPFGETAMISMTALEGPESGTTVVVNLEDEDSSQGLINCMQSHLLQVYSMGSKYRDFASTYFTYDMLEMIATKAHESLKKTQEDGMQHCSSIVNNKAFYLACSLPVSISEAAQWYGGNHNGFTQFIMNWIKSGEFKDSQCNMLLVITFGQSPATWVSLTIVPTHENEEDPVEIMSVDFLNEAEKAMLALDFDHHGRVA